MTNEICKHGNKIGECGAANCPFMLILTPNTESWQQEYDKVLGIEGDYRDTLIKSFIVGLLEDMRLNAKREVVELAIKEIEDARFIVDQHGNRVTTDKFVDNFIYRLRNNISDKGGNL